MLTDIRLLSHQLAKPRFRSPKELVAWMGAVQAQEYTMAKWAVGTRLKSSSLRVVDDALAKGEILRTHILRPTWHFIVAEDIRWMLQLSGGRIRTAPMIIRKIFARAMVGNISGPCRKIWTV